MKIGQLLERDFSKPIEEIIKVNNADEQTVYTELTEYVATDRIKEHYRRLLKAMVDAKSTPTEGIGVWISGFFGSGKSSFAKNLGYVLANRVVLGKPASELFVKQVRDDGISQYVDWLNKNVPYEVFMFDVQVDLAVQTSAEQIAEVMYRVLLRELDYAEDYDIAELEIKLETEGKLDALKQACLQRFQQEWQRVRKGAAKFSRTSALVHDIDPSSFTSPTSFLDEVKARPMSRITVREIVERCFDLSARRRPGKAFVFVVDEMGQYVARSGDKLENLRAVVEQFGKVSLERMKKKQLLSPAWIIVTAQEKLEEVYDYAVGGRVELPKLQDRFKYPIHLSPADIREVATKRVLAKTPEGQSELRRLFKENEGTILANCRLERTHRSTGFDEQEFVDSYPYLPHYIELSIDIMNGLRAQQGAPRHVGGANRTIIRQADQMIAGERTRLMDQPVKALVTVDKIYELVEGNLPSEKQKDILDIRQRFDKHRDNPGLAARVAQVICLLEFVRDLPRTPKNIAGLLVENVGDAPPVAGVEAVLAKIKDAQFVRETEDGWKLQTQQEKSWENEKLGYRNLKRGDRNDLLRKALKEIFESSKVRTYHYKNLRSFSLALGMNEHAILSGGDVPMELIPLDEAEDFTKRQTELVTESLQDANKNRVLWLFQVPQEVENLLASQYASAQMVFKYDNLRSQGKITVEEAASLQTEKGEALQIEKKLMAALTKAVENGVGFFRAREMRSGDLGKDLSEMLRTLFERIIPDLYPKVGLGCRRLKGSEAEDFLKQANLNSLPQVFYSGEQGLNLVIKENNRFVPNPNAEIAQEIVSYLKREHQYGNKVTGKQIAEQFCGLGYGWQQEVVQLVLALLFRAGSIVITHQGRPYRSYQDPGARQPFATNTAFRAASFAPRESIDLKTLTTAVKALEEMIGQEVDVEEGAIAEAFKKLARTEKDAVLPALATAQANRLPVVDRLRSWAEQLDEVLAGGSEDNVRTLAFEGKSLREVREKVQRIRGFLSDNNIELLRQAGAALTNQAPILKSMNVEEIAHAVQELSEILEAEDLPERFGRVSELAETIDVTYRRLYAERLTRRFAEYKKATEEVTSHPNFELVDEPQRAAILAPLRRRAVESLELLPFRAADITTGTTVQTLEEDLDLLPSLRAGAVDRLRQAVQTSSTDYDGVEVIRLSDFLPKTQSLDELTDAEIDQALEQLKERLYRLRELKRKVIWE
jgi:hypothetical protein